MMSRDVRVGPRCDVYRGAYSDFGGLDFMTASASSIPLGDNNHCDSADRVN